MLAWSLDGDRIEVPPGAGRRVPADLAEPFAGGSPTVPPLLVADRSWAAIDVASRYADRWNAVAPGGWGGDMTGAVWAASSYLDERCVARGRDPASV